MPSTVETTELLEIDSLQDPEPDPAPVDEQPAKPKETDTALREATRALKEMRASNRQLNETAQFWMEQAKAGSKKAAEPEVEKPLSVDLVEAITNNDQKAVKAALREMGFVSKDEVDRTIAATRGQISKDQELYDQFPDLADNQSEMFQRTAEIYNDLARDPHLKASGRLAEIAAKMADKELHGAEPARSRRAPAPTDLDVDDDAEDREAERVARVGRQSGDRGRRTAARTSDDDALDAAQKTIVAKLRAAGANITEDSYRKRAQQGVRMSGMPTRRPRY